MGHLVNAFVGNSLDLDVNLYYLSKESALKPERGDGKYDLAYYGDNAKNKSESIKGKYSTGLDKSGRPSGIVNFNGNEEELGAISNILAGKNASQLGLNYGHLYAMSDLHNLRYAGNGEIGERGDKILYAAGYKLDYERRLYGLFGKKLDSETIKHEVTRGLNLREEYMKQAAGGNTCNAKFIIKAFTW